MSQKKHIFVHFIITFIVTATYTNKYLTIAQFI